MKKEEFASIMEEMFDDGVSKRGVIYDRIVAVCAELKLRTAEKSNLIESFESLPELVSDSFAMIKKVALFDVIKCVINDPSFFSEVIKDA